MPSDFDKISRASFSSKGESNSIFIDSEWPMNTAVLTHVAETLIPSSKIFFFVLNFKSTLKFFFLCLKPR